MNIKEVACFTATKTKEPYVTLRDMNYVAFDPFSDRK